MVGALAALGGFLYKMLKGDDSSTAWQSSYQPAPAPTPPTPAPSPTASALDDASGASPDEAVADAVAGEKVHEVTTPDSPVEETDVSAEPDPKAPQV